MSLIYVRMGKLMEKTGLSRAHLQRLAIAGEIPGARRRQGKHWKFPRSAELMKWCEERSKRESKRAQKEGRARRRADRKAHAVYKPDGLKQTGNGYSAIIDAERWARTQIAVLESYSPERAKAILSDALKLREYFAELDRIAGDTP